MIDGLPMHKLSFIYVLLIWQFLKKSWLIRLNMILLERRKYQISSRWKSNPSIICIQGHAYQNVQRDSIIISLLRVSRYHFTAKNNLRLVQMTHLRLGIGSTRNYKTAHNKPAKTENPQQILIKTENRIQNHYLSQAVWITKIRKIFFESSPTALKTSTEK